MQTLIIVMVVSLIVMNIWLCIEMLSEISRRKSREVEIRAMITTLDSIYSRLRFGNEEK